jgi:hypothetical protein
LLAAILLAVGILGFVLGDSVYAGLTTPNVSTLHVSSRASVSRTFDLFQLAGARALAQSFCRERLAHDDY